MKTQSIVTTLVLLFTFATASLAQMTQLGFYASEARKAGKEDIAVAFETLEKAAASLTPAQRELLKGQVENFSGRKMVKDAEYIASKLGLDSKTGVAAPTITHSTEPAQIQLPNLTEPREIAHNSKEPGFEQEDPLAFNHRTALQYQVNQWTALAGATSDTARKNAFTKYAAAYSAALIAYDGGVVTADQQKTFGPALDHFEKEATRKGMLENARAIKIAIEKGKFLRTLEISSYVGSSATTSSATTSKSSSTSVPAPTPVIADRPPVAPEPPAPDKPAPKHEPAADLPPPTPVTAPEPARPGRVITNPAKPK